MTNTAFQPKHSEVTPDMARDHGLTPEEYARLRQLMGRTPNLVELGVASSLWSEHCSYKSSKKWLKTLPTEASHVIQGPGENAGVIDIGDNHAIVFKIESHNSPSNIEPFQGAATGVGGIMRDVFTMGARPIANLNALRFGEPTHPKTKHLVSGVVKGIGSYGNCMGVPTVAGETNFHKGYNAKCLVNCMTVGLADKDNIFYAAAGGIGNPIVYVGSKTGKDGIHGATMSSAPLDEDNADKRPTVQVGDPFMEKLLLEACLELMQGDAIVAIQDMGAAGLTSSAAEMASKGEVGVELWLDKVPAREPDMTPYEFMLSESQERMLMILKPGSEEKAKAIFDKWELDFAIIGKVTDTGHLVLHFHGEEVGDLPVPALVDNAPEYDRPWKLPEPRNVLRPKDIREPADYNAATAELMTSPAMASRAWIWEQYDHTVMGDTNVGPGGDAAVVRIHGSQKAIATTVDCTPRYCYADPVQGGAQAVAENYRNLTAVGAQPLAVTNNLNFGNPERENIMGQFVGCVTGLRNACEALDFPVVSGNVSLYNEIDSESVHPAPVIGSVGLIDDITTTMTQNFKDVDESIVLIGKTDGWLGASLYLEVIEDLDKGAPPPVDLNLEKKAATFIRKHIEAGDFTAVHDVSDGGCLAAIIEMAFAGNMGATLDFQTTLPLHAFYFGEDQARYVVTTKNPEAVLDAAKDRGLEAQVLGKTTAKTTLTGPNLNVNLADLKKANEAWMPAWMGA